MPDSPIPLPAPLPAPPSSPPKPRRRRTGLLLLATPLLLAALALGIPPVFRALLLRALQFEAARAGVTLAATPARGHLFSPVTFDDVTLAVTPTLGARLHAAADQLTLSLEPRRWLAAPSRTLPVALRLDHLDCTVEAGPAELPDDTAVPPKTSTRSPSLFRVARFDVTHATLAFRAGRESLVARGVTFSADPSREGEFAADEIAINASHLRKRFNNASAKTALRGPTLSLANATLAPNFLLASAHFDLAALGRGTLHTTAEFQAFGGSLRADATAEPRKRRLYLEASAYLAGIDLADLAAFIDTSGTTGAGGKITDGKLSFHGSPADPENATLSTRFTVAQFRWGSRAWDHLEFGATLLKRRVDIPDLELRQAANSVRLHGHVTLPKNNAPWWTAPFALDLQSHVERLQDLSALAGPAFADTEGRLVADGSVRGENGEFRGQIVLSGSGIAFRGAPLDRFEAALRLDGREIHVANLEFINGADYLRAKGSIAPFAKLAYQGECRAAVGDLTRYAPLLRPPLLPLPLAGSLTLDWSGDGSAKHHSGVVSARFAKLAPLSQGDPSRLPPLDGSVEGSYAPGNVFIKKIELASAALRLAASAAITPDRIELRDITGSQDGRRTLSGSASIPANIWTTWPRVAFDPAAQARVQITAHQLSLKPALALARVELPCDAHLDATLDADAPLGDLPLDASLRVGEFTRALGGGATARATARLHLGGRWSDATLSGTLRPTLASLAAPPSADSLSQPRELPLDPLPRFVTQPFNNWKLDVAVASAAPFPVLNGGSASANLHLAGSAGNPTLSGTLTLHDTPVTQPDNSSARLNGSLAFSHDSPPANPILSLQISGTQPGNPTLATLHGPANSRITEIATPTPTPTPAPTPAEPAPPADPAPPTEPAPTPP